MKKQSKGFILSDADYIMCNTFEHLVSDLAAVISFNGHHLTAIHEGIKTLRTTGNAAALRLAIDDLPLAYNLDPYVFKALYQIRSFLKRYCFERDLYTSDDLKRATVMKFLEVQERIGCRHELKFSTKLVLQRARKIVKKVLGPLDMVEWFDNGRFSTKACVGFPTPKSYLHDKIAGRTTGSFSHHELLNRYFANDQSVVGVLFRDRFGCLDITLVDTLDFHQVPKTFKINRGMMPNTSAGSLLSSGLEKMITRRLKNVRIDLSRQPEFHKVLAKASSISRSLVTADLSSASDTFTSDLINRLVPRDWFRALNGGRAKYVRIDGAVYSLQSFMAMGIGFTFPLQTLLYYAIIKAIQELHGSRGTISVFGDDLIYPRGIHKFVVDVLNDCKFQLNQDKTFVHAHFRESCGGDFYHGIDVRPCQPEGRSERLGKWNRLALIHKLANGLTARWTEHEIPSTLLWLQKEAASHYALMPVPDDFPDYAGFKRITCNAYLPIAARAYSTKTFSTIFTCLLMEPKLTLVPSLVGYYWDKMREKHQDALYGVESHDIVKGIFPRAVPRDLYSSVVERIKWLRCRDSIRRVGQKPKYTHSRITGQRHLVWFPTVPDKVASFTVKIHQAVSILAS